MRSLLLLAAVVLAPGGQAMTIQADPPQAPWLQPDEAVDSTIDVEVMCEELIGLPTERYLLHESRTGHPGLLISGQAYHRLPDDLCATGGPDRVALEVRYTLLGSMDVPGEVPIGIDHTFSIEGEAEQTTIRSEVVMAWQGRFTAIQEDTHKQGGPQKQLAYGITVTNHGNAPTLFRFELVGPPAQGDVVVPTPLLLGSASQGDDRTTATTRVLYSTPFENGDNHANETFTIRIIPESAKDPEIRGEPVELEFTGVTDGVYVPSPFALLPLAIAGMVAWTRKRG